MVIGLLESCGKGEISVFPHILAGGTDNGSRGAGLNCAIESTLVDGIYFSRLEAKFLSRSAYHFLDLVTKLIGYGTVERDIEAISLGGEYLNEDIARLKGAGMRILKFHNDVKFSWPGRPEPRVRNPVMGH